MKKLNLSLALKEINKIYNKNWFNSILERQTKMKIKSKEFSLTLILEGMIK